MSLFALLSTSVAIPLGLASAAVLFFYLRARSAERRRLELDQRREARQHVRRARQVTVASSAVPVSPAGSSGDSMPEFRPLSFYLNGKQEGAPAGAGDHPLSEMPGMDASMQLALRELGYTSVEQVARWGRADVRAVSALLGVDQRLIESDWVARARRLLSIG